MSSSQGIPVGIASFSNVGLMFIFSLYANMILSLVEQSVDLWMGEYQSSNQLPNFYRKDEKMKVYKILVDELPENCYECWYHGYVEGDRVDHTFCGGFQ